MTVPPGFKVTLFAGEPDVVQPIAMAIDDRGPTLGRRGLFLPQARARQGGQGPHPHLRGYRRRRPVRHAQGLRRPLEPGQRPGRSASAASGSGRPPSFCSFPTATATTARTVRPRSCSTAGASTILTKRSTASPGARTAGCTAATASSLTRASASPALRAPSARRLNAAIWRYHPTRHAFEVFAHGTSNPWGIDFDSDGQMIITACVIPHLYHMIQGGRYERQGGQHFNPYTYDDIKTIADHRHYLGANPHGGNGRSDSAGGGHAHSGAMIYQGGSWPDEYRGSLFMNNIHGARINRDILKPSGSGFVGSHAPDFLLANDLWSQIISLKYGPDGGVFMIDWYDKNQCHHNDVNGHDRTNGRIFKVSYGETKGARQDLRKLSSRAARAVADVSQRVACPACPPDSSGARAKRR